VALKVLRTESLEKARKVRLLRTVPALLAHPLLRRWLETRTRIANMGRATPSEHPAVLWHVYLPSLPLERFSRLDRDSHRYRATPLHGEWAIMAVEVRG